MRARYGRVFTMGRDASSFPTEMSRKEISLTGNCMARASGDKDVGNFVNGQIHGFGEYFYKNGDRYKGCWSEGQRDGFGIYTYANGVIELGEYRQNMRHGAAIQLSKSEAYVDQYSNGTRVKSVKYSGLDLDV